MSALSDYAENKLLDHAVGTTSFTMPATVRVALFTTSASLANLEAGTLTGEVSGGSYARQTPTFSAASGGATSNTGTITFTNMPGAVTRFVALMDSATIGAGNVLFYGQLAADKTTTLGDTFTIAIGDLDVTLA